MKNKQIPHFIGCEEYRSFFFKSTPTGTTGRYEYQGDTPNGGKYILLLFVGTDNKPTTMENAGFVELQELDANRSLIHIEHGKADAYRVWE